MSSNPAASVFLGVFVALLLPSPGPDSGLLRPAAGLSLNGTHVNLLSIPPGYEPRTYPDPERDNGGNPTMVDVVFVVEDIMEVNDQTFSMSIELKILMSWKDPRIKMNPSVADILNGGASTTSNATSGGGEANQNLQLEQLVLEQGGEREAVWSPNFSIAHLIEFTKLETLRPRDILTVLPEGNGGGVSETDFRFLHEGIYVVRFKCPMDFSRFPFDNHFCYFETFLEKPSSVVFLRSAPGEDDNGDGWGWAATTTTIEYVTEFAALPEDRKSRMVRMPYVHSSVSIGGGGGGGSVAEEHRNGFMNVSVAGFRIELVRKVNYFIFNYFVPSGLFVVISWVSFVIPPESVPGRVALIITTLLVLVNISNSVFSVSPAAESINSLQMWILICISFVFVTVAEYAVVLFIMRQHRRRTQRKTLAVKSLVLQVASAVAGGNGENGVLAMDHLKQQQRHPNSAVNSKRTHMAVAPSSSSLSERMQLDPALDTQSMVGGGGGNSSGLVVTGRERMTEAEEEEETRLQVMIANIDYAFVILMSVSFAIFNVAFWALH